MSGPLESMYNTKVGFGVGAKRRSCMLVYLAERILVGGSTQDVSV